MPKSPRRPTPSLGLGGGELAHAAAHGRLHTLRWLGRVDEGSVLERRVVMVQGLTREHDTLPPCDNASRLDVGGASLKTASRELSYFVPRGSQDHTRASPSRLAKCTLAHNTEDETKGASGDEAGWASGWVASCAIR